MSRRYVVLHHTGYGEDHFDLMLEVDADGPLLTWRCTTWPPDARTDADAAFTPLPPHRRAYLDYEGEVSGGRGRVRRVAAGEYALPVLAERLPAALRVVNLGGRLVTLPKEVREKTP